MKDVDTLQECRWATMEERALSRQIDRLLLIMGPQGVGSQAMQPAGDRKTNNATAKQMQQLDGLIEKLQRKREEDILIIQRAEEVIDRIASRKDKIVIREYYIEGESDYQIARQLEISQITVNRIRNRVIDELGKRKKKTR